MQQQWNQLYRENLAPKKEIDQASMFEEIVGNSPALRGVLSRVSKVAPTHSTVLITGETGMGKELIARAVHKRSQRSSRAKDPTLVDQDAVSFLRGCEADGI